MDAQLFDLLRCPDTGQRFKLEQAEEREGRARSGWLVSPGSGKRYPIREFIPRFVPESNYADSFGFQWKRYARVQLDSHTGLTLSRDRLFRTTGWSEDMRGKRILEAGSGAGRFTEILLGTGADVYSFDYSAAVEANAASNGSNPRLHLFQGDLFAIPFEQGTFDKVLCLGVIQHTPDPQAAFRSLARQLRPGGELAIDVYAWRLSALLHWRFLLRPITKRMNKVALNRAVETLTPRLLPLAIFLRRIGGRLGARLVPVAEFSALGLPPQLHRQWAILDTFDWYSPAYDFPQTLKTVRRWFGEAGLVDVTVEYGPNGIIGRGRRPAA